MQTDGGSILQGVLAILITVGCFVAYFQFQTVPEWATQMLVLVYGFFFGSRYGASAERKAIERSVKNES